MSTQTREESNERDPVLSSQTICAFADELFRLAKETKNLVSRSVASPRLLSNLTAMTPIISLLSNQGYSTILNPEPNRKPNAESEHPQDLSSVGYL